MASRSKQRYIKRERSMHHPHGKMLTCSCFGNKEDEAESWAMRNGRRLLEESISLFDGKVNPIRCFSARAIEIATNNFDKRQLFHQSKHHCLYRGYLQDQAVIVKRYKRKKLELTIRDIVVASRLSVHKNVLKLIGCCLETKLPSAVYESFDCDGSLHHELRYDPRSLLPWKLRLKIAVDLSNLIAYLHTALPRPLVHRDIQPQSILVDKENGVVKLFNFDHCMSLPEGKSFIKTGIFEQFDLTFGYIDPEYLVEDRFNEKADIYGFGVTLLNLLSGLPNGGLHAFGIDLPWSRDLSPINSATLDESPVDRSLYAAPLLIHARHYVENERFQEFLDPRLSAGEPWEGKERQFKDLCMLALECTNYRGVDRPNMTEVGTKLAGMYRSAFSNA